MPRPALAVTLGDPAGIGPEVIAGAWHQIGRQLPFTVIGDADVLAAQGLPVVGHDQPHDDEALAVIHMPCAAPVRAGHPDPANGPAIAGWIEQGVRLCLSGQARALVTAPIAKATLYASGFRFPGHTEFIAELTADVAQPGPRGPVMMLSVEGLRVCLVTIHVPLAEVSELLTAQRLRQTILVAHDALRRDFGIAEPCLAVAGLNPHAGEGGALGLEEVEVIQPTLEALRAEGLAIEGPLPADTLFHAGARSRYDAAICLYHDQGLIPVKTLDFWRGVNTTLGLPLVRTSPDHGTGFDIAGQGRARPDSLIAALIQADQIARNRGL